MKAISINNLTKIYKNGKKAISDLSMSVEQGEIFALLGNNGAGKSSLINILNTYEEVTSGEVLVLGKGLKEKNFIRSQIACVSQNISTHDHLTLYENMIFQSKLYNIEANEAKKRIEKLIEEFRLGEYTKGRVSTYSGGVKRRLDVAMSMISHPKILFLDEPTVAMDIESRKAMWEIAKNIREAYNTTIFLTTHYLEEADMLSDTICIIKDGHEIVQGSPESLRKYIDQQVIRIDLYELRDVSKVIKKVRDLPIIKFLRNENCSIFVGVEDCKNDFIYLNKIMIEQDIYYKAIEVVKPSLDDIFLKVINSTERSA